MYKNLPKGPVKTVDGKISPPNRDDLKQSMEALIHHFKLFTEGFRVPKGKCLYGSRGTERGIWSIFNF